MSSTKSQSYRSLFVEIAESKGYKVYPAKFADRKNNVDYNLEGQIKGKKTVVSVDIKKRNAKNANSWVYIEYTSAQGKDGWLYGKSNFIVFETGNKFILTPRKKLLEWLKKNQIVRWDLPYVDQPWSAKYRLFRRKNTMETITQIKVSDLYEIEGHKVWQKH